MKGDFIMGSGPANNFAIRWVLGNLSKIILSKTVIGIDIIIPGTPHK